MSCVLCLPCLHLRGWFKGADTVSLLRFLEHRLAALVEEVEPDATNFFTDILSSVASANRFMTCVYHTALWLSREERNQLLEAGYACVKAYQKCATHAYNLNLTRYRYFPKLHMFGEILFGLEQERRLGQDSLSPLAFCTQLDEDFIGKIAFLSRSVSVRTVHSRTLSHYKIALAQRWF